MHIPQHFYYEAPRSESTDYGVTPTGDLSVPRLLANAPCWQKPSSGMDKKPKKLVINCTVETLFNKFPRDEIHAIRTRFTDLQKQGFTIYQWHNGSVRPLTSTLQLSTSTNDERVNDQIITDAAMQQLNLTHDEVLVLNEDDLYTFMLGGKGDWPDSDDFTTINLQNSPISTESLDALLAEKADVIKSLDLSGCSNLAQSELCETMPLPHLRELILQRETINDDDDFESNLSEKSVIQLIQRAPQLDTVFLNGKNYNTQQIMENLVRPTLSELNIVLVNTSLDWIFAANTQLKKLNIMKCMLMGNLTASTPLDTIEELRLHETLIPGDDTPLNTILSQAHNLITLELVLCVTLPINTPLEFPSLKELRLTRTKTGLQLVKPNSLRHILAHAPLLEKLDLSQCILENDTGNPLQFPALQVLRLYDTLIPTASLESMLTPTLKVLDLTYLRTNHELNQPLHLTALEQAMLQGFNSSAVSFAHLLAEAHQLRELTLSDCVIYSVLTEPLHFEFLEELSLSNDDSTPFNATSLENLLRHANKLKKLTINNLILEGNITDDLPLFFLEEILLANTTITAESLKNLLINASKLKKITLSNCTVLGDINDDFPSLSSVEELIFDTVVLSPQTLKALTPAQNSLKKIQFCKVSGIGEGAGVNEPFTTNALTNLEGTDFDAEEMPDFLNESPPTPITSNFYNGIDNIIQPMLWENVTEIDFCVGPPLNSDSQLQLMQLPNLKILKLNSFTPTPNAIEVLRSGTLEELILSAPLDDVLDAPITELPNARTLKKLCLINYNIQLNSHPEIEVGALEKLTLQGGTINAADLAQILTSAPLLHSFELLGTTITGNIFDFLNPKLLHNNVLQTLTDYYQLNPEILSQTAKLKPITSNEEEILDADTTPDLNKSIVTFKYFYAANNKPSPLPNDYRLTTYNQLDINPGRCGIKDAFRLRNEGALELQSYDITQADTDLYLNLNRLPNPDVDEYYGRKTLQLSQDWQALPSLSSNEYLTHYHLDMPGVEVTIGYSVRDGLHYIRSDDPPELPVTLDYLLTIPKALPTLPADIAALVESYRDFQIDALKIKTPEIMTGPMYMQALQDQKCGACRHRSVAFKDAMQKRFPSVPVRIVSNDCHMFVEVQYEGLWISCNLGGYPADLEIKEPSLPPALANDTLRLPQTQATINLDAQGQAVLPEAPRYFTSAPPAPTHEPTSPKDYFFDLLRQQKQSELVQFSNTARVADAGYHLQEVCKNTGRPCFYINSPDDLVCSATWIERDAHNQGIIHAGPGGPLFEFLKKHKGDSSHPVLIVNYNHFTAADIVRFNALLDDTPNADGIPLPKDATVIGLMNPNERGAYTGLDFTSRFAARHHFPERLTAQLDIPQLMTDEEHLPANVAQSQSIDLYTNSHWEERLLGRWVLKGQQLTFVEGELITAINAGKEHFDIKNGPWHDKKFLHFWQMAKLTGQFQCAGKTYYLPENFALTQSSGLQFKDVATQISTEKRVPDTEPIYVLNPSTLAQFFNQYRCNNEEQAIYQEPGYLEANAGYRIAVHLSHAISPAAWSELLDACDKWHVQLELTVAPGIRLPSAMGLNLAVQPLPEPTPWPIEAANLMTAAPAVYIDSSDTDVALTYLKADVIIDVSELEPASLLINMDGKLDAKTLRFKFNEKKGALLNALEQGQTVILKGQFSPQMQHYLSEELIKRGQNTSSQGQLILVSDKPNLFPNLPCLKHTPTVIEKRQLLVAAFSEELITNIPEKLIENQSLAELNAMLRYQSVHPEAMNFKQSWLGMETLPKAGLGYRSDHSVIPAQAGIHPEISTGANAEMDPRLRGDDKGRSSGSQAHLKRAKAIAQAFNQQRLDAVQQGLTIAPFVFLAGMTGVGKTTFIEQVWQHQHPNVHFGEAALSAWAKDTRDGIKTLFIDEANLSARQWSEFEGLFNNPPGIIINNEYVTLTADHKIIFAGNPVSYGGGRHLPELFKRHGGSIIFEPMPPEYIYHEILKPVFEGKRIDKEMQEAASRKILDVAQHLTQLSRDEVLISARELAMMALLAINYCSFNPEVSLVDATAFYAYTLAQSFVPEASRAEFDQHHFAQPLPPSNVQIPPQEFSITPSNQEAFDALTSFLSLRETRRHQTANKVQQAGGLGGLILEGEPGIGKSELVIAALTARNYQEGRDFYIIPPSMALEAKKELLLKAYRNGAVVIINEINSSPMMERFLNDLLMGKTPPGVEQGDIKPGFMVIGTQNPTTMAGRARASLALQHRMQTIVMHDYKPHEMETILIQKGLSKTTAKEMTAEYYELCENAKKHHLPAPLCFRDLIKRAEWEIKSNERVSALVSPDLPDIDWEALIDDPYQHANNKDVKNRAQALVNIYCEVPDRHQDTIKTKLYELATDHKHQQPEAWLALALISYLEDNQEAIEACLKKISPSQLKRTGIRLFERGAPSEHDKVCHALQNCVKLNPDVRGINAFITAYEEQIRDVLDTGKQVLGRC